MALASLVFVLSLAVPPDSTVQAAVRSPIGLGPATVPPITLLIGHSTRKSFTERLRLDQTQAHHRGRHALVGGLIGGAVGIVTCTVISNLINDPGTGFSTCTAKGYAGFGLGGAALGALVGSLL